MDETSYYKIKLAVTETELVRMRTEQAFQTALAKQQKILDEAGLDPSKQYRFDDVALTLVEIK